MPQQTLQTERITLVPLADEHFEWEVELDSDVEVMRYLTGRASTREEVVANHARRMAAAQKLDGLGLWVGLVDDEFVGWWVLQPAHGPDQPDDPGMADLGYRLLPRHRPMAYRLTFRLELEDGTLAEPASLTRGSMRTDGDPVTVLVVEAA